MVVHAEGKGLARGVCRRVDAHGDAICGGVTSLDGTIGGSGLRSEGCNQGVELLFDFGRAPGEDRTGAESFLDLGELTFSV